MQVSSVGLGLIQSFEGYHTRLPNGDCQAYLDKLPRPQLWSKGYKGLWTIGWGNTGPEVTEGTVWSRRYAEKKLREMVARHERAVENVVRVPLTQNQFDALVSLSYNMGIGKAKTLIKHVNNEDWDKAAKAFLMYNKAGGRVVNGLTRRRQAEKRLFETVGHVLTVPEASRKLTFLKRLRQWLAGLGISWAAIMQFWSDASQFVTDNSGWIAVGALAALFLLTQWVQAESEADYEEGRYLPSGYSE
jgi:lysozyme